MQLATREHTCSKSHRKVAYAFLREYDTLVMVSGKLNDSAASLQCFVCITRSHPPSPVTFLYSMCRSSSRPPTRGTFSTTPNMSCTCICCSLVFCGCNAKKVLMRTVSRLIRRINQANGMCRQFELIREDKAGEQSAARYCARKRGMIPISLRA